MTISVQTIIEIQNLYQQSVRSKKSKVVHQKEIHDLLVFLGIIASHYKPSCILTVEDASKLFELIYSVCLKKQKDTEEFIGTVVEKCFKTRFFEVLIKLKRTKVYSDEIFKQLWGNQIFIDDAFLQLIELMISSKQLEPTDILQVAQFPQKANHIYLCLVFLEKYKLNRFNKSLYQRAEFAEKLWKAWNHLVDNHFPFHETVYIPVPVIEIFIAMFQKPQFSYLLAEGIVLLFYKHSYYFDYYKLLCQNPFDAKDLAQAFVELVNMPNYQKTNIALITQYPRHATEIARALNILMSFKIHEDYHMLLHSNPYAAQTIARLVSFLVTNKLMSIETRSGILSNARHIKPLYNIVALLSTISHMMNLKMLLNIFANGEDIPEIEKKLSQMQSGELTNLNPADFDKLIVDIKKEKSKIEEEKDKKKQEEADLVPKAKLSPLEEIVGNYGAMHYLDEKIFNKKENIDKKISIDHIKNVFVQLLQVGLNRKEMDILNAMIYTFNFINRNENKIKVNIHKNLYYDSIFGKTNTNAWMEMMKVLREQTYQLLMVLVDNESDSSKKIALLEEMKVKSIFSEHRTNSFFNRFHETTTVKEIDKKIAAIRSSVSPVVSR